MDSPSKGLYRVDPKATSYNPDNTGRDLYIYNNNGGFMPASSTCKIDPVSKFAMIQSFVTFP